MRIILFFIILFIIFSFTPVPAKEDGQIVLVNTMGTVEETQIRVDKLIYYSDDLKVKARIFIPPQAWKENETLPLIVYNHDGVYGLSDETIQLCKDLAHRTGYIIVAPTYRGEDGSEGQIEVADGEVNDVLNAIKAMSYYKFADINRIALFGTSHGALISVMAAACDRKDQIRCVVAAYGVMDIITWWSYLTRDGKKVTDSLSKRIYGEGPEDRPEAFRKRMGIYFAPYVSCPVLIVQGKLDDIVPPNQAYSLKDTLEKAGKYYELKMYPNSGHGFLVYAPYAKDNEIYSKKEQKEAVEALNYIVEFMWRYLN